MNQLFSICSHKACYLLITISILFLSACQNIPPHQAYEGTAKANNEVATFIIPGEFNLLSIDGAKFKQLALRDGAVVKLLPGSHQLIIEYYDFFDLGGGEFEKVGSKPIAITFTAEAGNQYRINSVTFEDVEKSQAFAEKPVVDITNVTNKQAVPAKIKYNLYGKGLFTTLFGKSNSEPTTNPSEAENTQAPDKGSNVLETLKILWEKADENQQENFRQWLKSH